MTRPFLKFLLFIVLFFLLTLITQVGGIIFALSVAIASCFTREKSSIIVRATVHLCAFAALYVGCTLYLIPHLAAMFGRIPMPIDEYGHVKPATTVTCLLNRHYVSPKLRESTLRVAEKLNKAFPGSTLLYLDANFPFFNGFPLLPHRSHDDGEKLDVAFFYRNNADGTFTSRHPSWFGYGFSESAQRHEFDRSRECADQGHWQYSLLTRFVKEEHRDNFSFDAPRTKKMIEYFSTDGNIGKLLIEPHLISRLKLPSEKIGLHGCNTVRHDDHLHIQLK